MVDTLRANADRAAAGDTLARLGLRPGEYGLVTLHRPANVDAKDVLSDLVGQLKAVSAVIPIVFAIHPRTRNRLKEFGLLDDLASCKSLQLIDPLGGRKSVVTAHTHGIPMIRA